MTTTTASITQSYSDTSILTTGIAASFPSDPMTVLEWVQSNGLLDLAPVALMGFIFQNIVPTIVKILDYDRVKTTLSIFLGSFVPLVMYTAWCSIALMGLDDPTHASSPSLVLMTIFSVVTIAGSCLGCGTSMVEEVDAYLQPTHNSDLYVTEPRKDMVNVDSSKSLTNSQIFSIPAVVLTAILSYVVGEVATNDLTGLLFIGGAYISPILYFILPLLMVYKQQEKGQLTLSNEPNKEVAIESHWWTFVSSLLATQEAAIAEDLQDRYLGWMPVRSTMISIGILGLVSTGCIMFPL